MDFVLSSGKIQYKYVAVIIVVNVIYLKKKTKKNVSIVKHSNDSNYLFDEGFSKHQAIY